MDLGGKTEKGYIVHTGDVTLPPGPDAVADADFRGTMSRWRGKGGRR